MIMLNPSRFLTSFLLANGTLSAVPIVEGYNPVSTEQTDALAATALGKLRAYMASSSNQTCTVQNAAKRREWGDLSVSERVNYTSAVNCLMSLPSRYNNTEYPGAKSRYDDFNVPHIAQTLTVHFTANFLSFHRYFVWAYERALRDECGYTGYQPYWNWGKWAEDPINSPLFDGGEGSISGNGEYEPHNFTNGLKDGDISDYIPPGSGGGCVKTGPFANYTVNLGPISPTLAEPEVVAVNSTYDYNPRCMKRDISSWVSSRWTTEQNVTDLLTQWDDIIDFQDNMQATNMTGNFGVHGGGHFTFQGDPAGDIYSAPGDPAFWLHHGQIDRVWWIWQNLDPASRTSAFGGTITSKNEPPSRNGSLSDTIDVGVNADIMEISLAMSSVGMTGGPFCYVYV